MSKVYLSGPIISLTYHEARYGWRMDLASKLIGINVLSPMRHEGYLSEITGPISAENLPKNLFSRPRMIVTKDLLDIDECDLMVVNLLGATRVSIGTMVELGYAKAKGKVIVTIMSPTDVIHNHPFVTENSIMVETLDEAAAVINSLLSEGL